MLIPIILGSDKTTVSVTTGQNKYWPIYMSIGNIYNNVCCTHHNGVMLLRFLPIPKGKCLQNFDYCLLLTPSLSFVLGTKKDMKDGKFWHCRQQIFHPAIAHMLQPLKAAMTVPDVIQCPDGHFCHAVYSLGPYIGDYPEQALLSCIIQGWCAK